MISTSRARGRMGIACAVAALTILGLPATAAADPVGDLINGLGLGGGEQGGGQVAGPAPAGPHASGTVAAVDVSPPAGTDSGGLLDDEEAVVGRSLAEQNHDGSYHGHITILALFGQEILGVDTTAGQRANSPFQPLQGVLDQLCTGTSDAVCVEVLPASSSTTGSGSENDFAILRASSVLADKSILLVGVGESSGSLSDDGHCQTASAGTSVASADLFEQLSIDLLQSTAQSIACANGTGSQSSDSTVASVNGTDVPLPNDCSGGTNAGFGVIGLVSVSCNVQQGSVGDGTAGGSQTAATLSAIGTEPPLVGSELSSSDTAAASQESGTPGSPGDDDNGAPGEGGSQGTGSDGPDTSGQGAGSPASGAEPGGGGSLAFTGANLGLLVIIGLALLVFGVGSQRASRSRLSG